MSDVSPLERIRRRYDELRTGEKPSLHVPVGRGLDGQVVVEYSEPDWEETQDLRGRWADDDSPRAPLYAQAEQLAKCCLDIHLRDDNAGVEIPGLPGKYLPGLGGDDGTASFHSAAGLLGKPVEDPIQAVWSVLLSDWEVERHGLRLAQWEPSLPSQEVEKAAAGESPAATAA